MSYFLTEDQKMMRDVASKFAKNELMPLANQIDHDEAAPPSLTERCVELGFLGLWIPEEYGGVGADLTTVCLVLEELAKASPSFAGLLSVEMILCPGVVHLLGTEEQRQRVLPASARGERLMAFSQTEPAGAINVKSHQTKLTPDGNGYRLNGAKLFCTQGQAKTYIVMCRTQRDGQDGYGVVLVEKEAPGFRVDRYEDKLGWRGTNTGPISFSDVRVEAADVLGDLLTGNASIAPVNQASFMGHAATSLGCAQGLLDLTLEYVKDRNLYGEPMAKLSPITDRFATIVSKLEACRALLYTSTRLYDEDQMSMPYGSMCKSFICETAYECCHQLLQMWGGSGMMNSTGVNRYFRDARTKLVAEGSTEIHNAAISAVVLGLPTQLGSLMG